MKQNKTLKRLQVKKGKRQKSILYVLVLVSILNAQSIFAQSATITGTVVDENNLPLPGVNVVLQNSQIGTITDFDGKYEVNIPNRSNAVLNFTFLGYIPKSVQVGSDTVIDVALQPDVEALSEVVVVGYGTQKKESVVGAIGTIKADDLKVQGNVSNMTDALTGAIPGLSVLSVSGLPGGGDTKIFTPAQILIRGKTTWNDSSPLILVDGVERNFNDIDINEVESLSILKDASATAVFGVKGGNGVILITTKRGKQGKSVFNIQAEYALESPSKTISVLPVPESAIARNIAMERTRRFNQGLWQEVYYSDEEVGYFRDRTYPYAYQNLDWNEVLYKDFAQSYRVNATASGGTERVKYFASASFNHIGDIMNSGDFGQGYIPQYSYSRFNIRSNFDFQITKSTKLAANFAGIYGLKKSLPSGSQEGLFSGTSEQSGDMPILVYEDGVYGADISRFHAVNSFYDLNFNGLDTEPSTTINMDYLLTQDLDIITKGLQVTGRLAYDNRFTTIGRSIDEPGYTKKLIDKEFYLLGGYYNHDTQTYMLGGVPANMNDWTFYDDPSSGGEGFGFVRTPLEYDSERNNLNTAERNLYYEAALRYSNSFNDIHNVSGLAMFSRQFRERGSGWPSKREDWVGRVTYDYDTKYLFEVNGAYNGSEKFGPNYRFDFFPSAAVGWAISRENFLKDINWLSQLKVRYSYGLVGNDQVNTGSTWPYLTIYDKYVPGSEAAAYYGWPNPYREYSDFRYNEGNPGNPDLRWETATKQNLGIDFAALKNALTVTLDVFKEDREDMLLGARDREATVPPIFGKPAPPANVGRAKSHGAEIAASYRGSVNNEFNYWISANWTTARSEVIFRESTELTLPHQRPEGFPIGQTTTSLSTGFYNGWDDLYTHTGGANASDNANLLPGDMVLLDFNSDGRYDSAFDNVPYGYPTYPQNNYGFSLGGDYKGIDLTVNFVGAYNTTRNINYRLFYYDNLYVPRFIAEATWSPEFGNSNPRFPAFALTDSKPYTPTGQFSRYDGSFLRVQSAQLGYTLPRQWLEPMGVTNFKLYVNGRNLFLWTDMPNDGVGLSGDGKNYPTKSQYNLGVNIQF